ncbi:LytR/AlgR family response regulator transcription factor [Xanthomarina gelatinilytica]|uniref:LytR/AlgR family response regulator transcription factor n=1 Tax=Xanthomarina gelatinilytica TaxID=1137281 RepID=UPI003AA98A2B
MGKYKVIIIDDERLAREEVKRYLNLLPEFEIVGEADNADNGKALIEAKRPHLIFLDIQMPEKTGFDLLNELTIVPEIVFTTAYTEYATKAFDVNALDYLVKPIREERFLKSIKKVKEELSKTQPKRITFSIQHKIFIKDGIKCHFIPLSDIRYIESLENYARFHFNGNRAMLKQSLNTIEKKLDATVFFRINRSQIINTQYIKDVFPHLKNRLKIVFTTGETFDVSSRQSVRFKNWNSL